MKERTGGVKDMMQRDENSVMKEKEKIAGMKDKKDTDEMEKSCRGKERSKE